MSIHTISDTIRQAFTSAGLDPESRTLKSVSATIRNALARAGLMQPPTRPAPTPPVVERVAEPVGRVAEPSARVAEPLLRADTPEDVLEVLDRRPAARPGQAQFVDRVYLSAAGSRGYKLFIPANLPDQPAPLIVMLHGCKQNPDDFAAGTRMNEWAERHGFLVAYPAQSVKANGSNCWNWFAPGDQLRDAGEPSILAGIAREVAARHAVDPQRVFAAGLSAGAAMAVILGVTHPDVFAAVGAHSGLPYGAAHDVASAFAAMGGGSPRWQGWRRPDRPDVPVSAVPTIVFHGDQDLTVTAANAEAIVEQVLAGDVAHEATLLQSRVSTPASAATRAHTTTVYTDVAGRPLVEHWVVHGAAHAWSGGSPDGSYTDAAGPDATAEMVRFFLDR